MTFLHPTALLWLGLGVPILLLYLIRVRPRELAVGTDQFWEQVFKEEALRSAWRRLRDPASLLAQLALLATIVLAMAEPVRSREKRDARTLAVIVDNSASMNATDGAPTRLAEAKRQAQRVVSSLGQRDQAALIVAGTHPRVVCGLTAERRVLGRMLDGIEPTDGPTRLVGAIELARRLLAGHKSAQIVVLTDGCDEALAGVAGAPDVQIHPVGRRSGNVGITLFQARRSLRDLTGYQILVEVGNYSDELVRCSLEIEWDGVTIDLVPLSIAPGATERKVLHKTSTEGGRIRARIDHADELAADNEAWAVLPARDPLAVAIVAPGGTLADLYIEKVFEANPLVRRPLALFKSLEEASGAADGPIRVYHREIPQRLPPGPALVIDPVRSCDLWECGPPLRRPIVGQQNRSSPLLAFVKLENAQIEEARSLTPKGRHQVLVALATGEPLYVSFDRPEGKILVLAAALEEPADLPLKTAFPIMVGNALSWFAGFRGDLRESVATGAVVDLEPATRRELKLWPPFGPPRQLPDGDRPLAIGPLEARGIWRVASRSDGPAVAEFACNLASPRESDLRPPASLGASRAALASGAGPTPVWYALFVLAWALFVLEWFCYQRRWVR
jgi:hypothetical protein